MNTTMMFRRLFVLALCALGLLRPSAAEAQTCPGPGSDTTVPITVLTGDDSIVPGGTIPLQVYRDGVLSYNGYVATGGAEVEMTGWSSDSTTNYSFVAGGNDYFLSSMVSGVSCTHTVTGPSACNVTCSGGANLTIFSLKGSYHGKVISFPKDKVQAVEYRWQDNPAAGGGFNTLADGTFQLPTLDPNNNWSQGVLNGGATKGQRTANFRVPNVGIGAPVPSTTESNANPYVLLFARAPYYEVPPCKQCPKPPDAVGAPVRVTTGEMYLQHLDASVGELALVRHYNSNRRSSGRYGVFGPGWNTLLDVRLAFPEAGVIEARDEDGMPSYFVDSNADGTYESVAPSDPLTWMETVAGGGYKRKHAAGGEEVFTSAGKLSSSTDASGVTTTYTRNGSSQVTSISRRGRSLVLTYVGGQVKEVKDGAGTLLATYIYDGSGGFSSVQYPDNTGYILGYDSVGRLTYVGDQGGRMIERHEYDSLGRATTSEIDEGREKFTLAYGPATTIYENDSTTVTDALGNATVYEFKPVAGILAITKITGPCSSCGGAGDVQEWEYDTNGNILKKRDAAGKEWVYTYDSNNRMLTETNPLNQTTTYTYDAQGRMLTRTGPDGSVTTYVQTAAGPTSVTQLVTASPLVERTTAMSYFATADARNGKVQTITDPRGKVTTMAYNTTTGDLTSVTDPLSHATTFGYDALGRRTTVTDALAHTTTTEYDIRGRVTKVTSHVDANGSGPHTGDTQTQFTYDKSGRRETVIDPMGRVTRYVYDDFGRLSTVLDPLNQATHYAYDLMGNLLSLKDAKNQTTSFQYDGHGRVTKTTYPGGAYETFTYDPRGRLATMIDRKSITTTYTYDDLGRLTGKSFTNDPTNTPPFSYTYDVAGRMLTAVNGTDTLTWTYNLAGELLSEQSVKNASTVAYTYDNGGNRLTVSLDGNLFVTYAYDDASRLTTITRGTNVFGFGYDNANRRTTMTYPNGVTTAYTYDNLNRLTNLAATHVPSSTPITNFGYQYDAAGNRTQKSTLDYTEDYGYDPLYRLTRADRTNPGAAPPNQWTWNYDAVGNRTSAQKDNEATTSTHNEKNQLLQTSGGGKMLWRGVLDEPGVASFNATQASINGQPARMLAGNVFEATLDLPAGANTVTIQAQDGSGNQASKSYSVNVLGVPATYTYDANSNLATKTEGADAWVYTWNAQDQLIAVARNGQSLATFSYDPIGRRVLRGHSGELTSWIYDGWHIIRQASGVYVSEFVQGVGYDEPIAGGESGSLHYFHLDGLGSLVSRTDAAGSNAGGTRYDAWGSTDDASTPFGFTGREYDAATELYYYRARYYDPISGRFLSEDARRDYSSRSLYSYVSNNPVNRTDPSGEQEALTPSRGPVYDPEAWNEGSRRTNNCYSYACNRRYPPGPPNKPQPGDESGVPLLWPTSCIDIKWRARADGLKNGINGDCPCDYYEVRLYFTPGYDYHWYRQDSNGNWSSKHGWAPVGKQIPDTDAVDRDARAWGYKVFCGTMCVPNKQE